MLVEMWINNVKQQTQNLVWFPYAGWIDQVALWRWRLNRV